MRSLISLRRTLRGAISTLLCLLMLGVSGCGNSTDPLSGSRPTDGSVVVGSQAYYSNEIIAEIYAQALEHAGWTVTRRMGIGQRDAYMPALRSGELTVFPEYTGNLLQYFRPETTARASADVAAALIDALPAGLSVLEPAAAADQDTYTVTAQFAADHQLRTLSDLSRVPGTLRLGGPAELEHRPYGPAGLESTYGVHAQFHPTGDTTMQDLLAGTIDVANVFSADPRIATHGLVTLADDRHLFLASQVVPLVDSQRAAELAPILNAVSRELTTADLRELNVASTEEQRGAGQIARRWLEAHPRALQG
ncbi:ABC transporter substrate-binding protein [Corynebacterium uberis]|uniref:ABC transporter substrate-binding protein n=1 Tax=Corynebacterium TaxID=1716 RepID=UPI001D0BBE0D|nr:MULTISPECIES: ABC transporter substrate-binding protein [Corynebacterium]MCZ9310251.1 ABC transporter substrate-binding protein [Corynebacterium sp. c6VSa_13]UDL73723.1 ABC transporter substrate-binding protein [Corynebacterium uberis]UDL75394.1 ABC transporter substrate-binding protein [Corynebacterium uberis]UDL77606.1 ABC transporter substrate-binding protein [Corynebacterium uberis]UDL79892.1 ABC transporter substrate-binding protein [Corynebacterium uberis]